MSEKNTHRPGGEIVVYQAEDGGNRIRVLLEDETVWLTQVQMAELFQTSVPNIHIHINHILEEGELTEGATIKDYLIVRSEGSREVKPSFKHYNLDMILSVGYRVRSPRGVQFRQWATERLREYLTALISVAVTGKIDVCREIAA